MSISFLLDFVQIVEPGPGTETYLTAFMFVAILVLNILARSRVIHLDQWIFREKFLALLVAAQSSALGPILAAQKGVKIDLNQVDAIILYCMVYFFGMGLTFLFASRMFPFIGGNVREYFAWFSRKRD